MLRFFLCCCFLYFGSLQAADSDVHSAVQRRHISNKILTHPPQLVQAAEVFAENNQWLPSWLSNVYALKFAPNSVSLKKNADFLLAKSSVGKGLQDLCNSNVWNTLYRWVFEILLASMSLFICLLVVVFFKKSAYTYKFLWIFGLMALFFGGLSFYLNHAYLGMVTLNNKTLTYAEPTDVEQGGPSPERLLAVLDETPNWLKVVGLKNENYRVWVKKSEVYFFESGQNICHDGGLSE